MPKNIQETSPRKQSKFYSKIPCVGHFSVTAQISICKLYNQLCKPFDIRLVFTTFKIEIFFVAKDALLEGLRTRVVINFRVQVVMLVMLVKPSGISPSECANTYFPTVLRTFLDICRVQSLVELLREPGLCSC